MGGILAFEESGYNNFQKPKIRTYCCRELILGELVGSIVKAVRDNQRSAAKAASDTFAVRDVVEKITIRVCLLGLGIGGTRKHFGLIIRSGYLQPEPRL